MGSIGLKLNKEGIIMREIFIRRSVRVYDERKVERDKIIQMLKAAMQAPSARNQQPWSFLVIEDKEKLSTLTTATPHAKMCEKAAGVICLLIDTTKNIRPDMWAQDMSAAMQNILLEATHLGLGAVWIGVYPNEERMENLKKMLNIPDRYLPFALCSFGYPKTEDANRFIDRFDPERIFFEEVK